MDCTKATARIDAVEAGERSGTGQLEMAGETERCGPSEIPNYRELEMRDQAPAVPGMLAKAGVKFAFYSDGVDTRGRI